MRNHKPARATRATELLRQPPVPFATAHAGLRHHAAHEVSACEEPSTMIGTTIGTKMKNDDDQDNDRDNDSWDAQYPCVDGSAGFAA